MFRKGRLSDNGQHNITKEKKGISELKRSKKVLPFILHLPWHNDQNNSLKYFTNCYDSNHFVH